MMLAVLLCAACARSALEEARQLTHPEAVAVVEGEHEGAEFWSEHETLLEEARKEWGVKHKGLYGRTIEGYVRGVVREAVAAGDEVALWKLVGETEVEGVYSMRLFTEEFGRDMQEEVAHLEASGIPLRRPNGMNRQGCILGQVGFEESLAYLTTNYLSGIAMMLFPDTTAPSDTSEEYSFIIRYEPTGDVSLAPHTDGSSVTFNTCLGDTFTGGEVDFTTAKIPSQPLTTLIHKGMHRHSATPIRTGSRTNLVTWLAGDGGYVRVAPYELHERATKETRWQIRSEEL